MRLHAVGKPEHQGRTIVYYDREHRLDGVYSVKRGGSLEEIADDTTAEALITAGLETTNQ